MNVSEERTRSLWTRTAVAPDAPRLAGKHSCDTVVVGAGIAGLSVAYELVSAGQKVVVVDRGPIAGGMTARTTAHLAPICDDAISALIDLRGEETARLFQESQEAAVARIEDNVKSSRHPLQFPTARRIPLSRQWAWKGGSARSVRQGIRGSAQGRRRRREGQRRAAQGVRGRAGAALSRPGYVPSAEISQPLVTSIRANGGRIFADSAVTKIDEQQDGVRLSVDGRGTIDAATAVFATNSPINDRLELHSKMAPYRTYAMAFTLPRGTLPDALYWDMADPYHYVRLNPGPGTDGLSHRRRRRPQVRRGRRWRRPFRSRRGLDQGARAALGKEVTVGRDRCWIRSTIAASSDAIRAAATFSSPPAIPARG